MDESVKVRVGKGKGEVWRLEEELDKVAVCDRFFSKCRVSTLPKKLLNGLETSVEVEK
jgi:hypothetical protein